MMKDAEPRQAGVSGRLNQLIDRVTDDWIWTNSGDQSSTSGVSSGLALTSSVYANSNWLPASLGEHLLNLLILGQIPPFRLTHVAVA
jgi:hypothetical protein